MPPRYLLRFFRWYCHPKLVDHIEGDLLEVYLQRKAKHGKRKADLHFAIDVLLLIRLSIIRPIEGMQQLNVYGMYKSYFLISVRNLTRNKLFSVINIFGLALSMSVGLMLIGVLADSYSYDRFHTNYSRIYRVLSQYQYLENRDENFYASTSMKAAKAIQESFPGHEGLAILHRGFEGDMKHGETTLPMKGYWSNDNIFNVFDFPLTKGNVATALKEPFSVVITERAAKKLLGDKEPLGESILFNNKSYSITGVVKDLPEFSHIHFEMLASLSTRDITEKDNPYEMLWDNMWNTWVYVLMPEQPELETFQANLDQLSAREDPTVKNTHIRLRLQAMSDIMVGEDLNNQISNTLGTFMIWSFLGLTFVVILSAGFNYTNLSIARALKRSKEVGIRKVIGAVKGNVMGQFVTEAVIIALLSLLAAVLLYVWFRPYFLGLNPDLQELLRLDLSFWRVLLFILFALFIGVTAGIFPALYFSRVNAIQVLKGSVGGRITGSLTTRKALIVVQYCISLMLITGTVVIYKQYHHFLDYDLGYDTQDILNIRLQDNNPELLIKELNELPEVKGISKSSILTSVGYYWRSTMKNPNNPEDSAGVAMNHIDENYLEIHNHQLLAGRSFHFKPKGAPETEIIVNEQVLKRFNIADQIPSKAIGQVVNVDRKDMMIIGVIRDFQYGRANNRSGDAVVMRYIDDDPGYVNVKVSTDNIPALNEKIASIWEKIDSVHPYEASLYDDAIKESLRGLDASMKLAGFIAFLAIVIASLGLLGMVVFTTETRIKEVSIRKVMGASEAGLLYLLGRGFFLLLALAALIALPITYLFFDQFLLPELANHAPIALEEMTIGLLAVMLIALLVIGTQTIKIARTNPATVLKNE